MFELLVTPSGSRQVPSVGRQELQEITYLDHGRMSLQRRDGK
jgi:hypothetical protein